MNTMTHAIVSAGIKVPTVFERIHNYLRDHPKTTGKRIAAELRANPTSIYSMLAQMENRRMLTSISEPMLCSNGSTRYTKFYSVAQKDYELPPMPKAFKPKYQRKGEKSVDNALDKLLAKPALMIDFADRPDVGLDIDRVHRMKPQGDPAPTRLPIDVESLTIREARALYSELDRIFGFGR